MSAGGKQELGGADPNLPRGEDAPLRAALVVGHAAHVFKLYGWMLRNKPTVHILTNSDGTGPLGQRHTAALLEDIERNGGRRGEIFTAVSDADIFRAILAGDAAFFIAIVDRLAPALVRDRIQLVVADAQEGCSPAHDLCRAMTDAAVEIAERTLGARITSLACHQTEWLSPPPPHDGTCLHLALDEAVFARKLAATQNYPEWGAVIADAIAKMGLDHFRMECLRPVLDRAPPHYSSKPHYEIDGERQVAQGRFETVIRYEDHIRPIWNAIRAHAAAKRL